MARDFSFLLFNQLDWTIVALFVVLFLWYIMRGPFKIAISLAVWLITLLTAQIGALLLEGFLSSYISEAELLRLFPFAFIFIFTFLFLNLFTSFLSPLSAASVGLAARSLAAFLAVPLLGAQLLVLLQFAYLFAIHDANYWYSSQLVPYVLTMEEYWGDWVITPLCRTSGLCVG